jgi:hypothetical protein
MSVVQIKYAPSWRFLTQDNVEEVRTAHNAGMYVLQSVLFIVEGEGVDAAEEAFDLTNNPGRQEERERVYGTGRSVSTGDIVSIDDDEQWLCLSFGWAKL